MNTTSSSGTFRISSTYAVTIIDSTRFPEERAKAQSSPIRLPIEQGDRRHLQGKQQAVDEPVLVVKDIVPSQLVGQSQPDRQRERKYVGDHDGYVITRNGFLTSTGLGQPDPKWGPA